MRQFSRECRSVTRVFCRGLAVCSIAGLAGCSASSERWNFSDLRSQPASSPSPVASNEQPQPAAARQAPSTSGRFASAAPGEFSGGYLQAARVDLPPLEEKPRGNLQSSAPLRTADGYGVGNHAPVTDGVYTGPRVSTPHEHEDDATDYDHDQDRDRDRERDRDRDFRPDRSDRHYDRPQVYDRIPDPEPEIHDRPRWRDRTPYTRDSYRDERPVDAPPPLYPAAPYPTDEGRSFYRDPARDYLPRKRDERAIGEQTNIKRPGDTVASDRGTGKVVTVAPGETVYDLSRRYGVAPRDILNSNGLYGQRLKPGQDILIPSRPGESFASVAPAAAKPTDTPCAEPGCHIVQKGETLPVLAKRYRVAEDRIVAANRLDGGKVTVGQAIVIPVTAEAAPKTPMPTETDRAKESSVTGDPKARTETASAGSAPAKPAGEQSCDAALSSPLPRSGKTFRKPVEGLIITQFGTQRDGKISEGVSISVPKGTPIKAAENGVVAYVGEELEGFGKLILIRHADDYVTAYAHADDILVKRCDIIKRGDVIAKAGATGDVSQPQVHFEIRKSQKAIDPVPLLSS